MEHAKKIIFLDGDGIGPEITTQAIRVMESLKKKYQLNFTSQQLPVGGACYDKYGTPITDEILDECKKADAIFLGAVGGPKWDELPFHLRPEQALLKLRKSLGLYANLRPVKFYPELSFSSPLKNKIIQGVDLIIVRELTGDVYFGEPRGIKSEAGKQIGFNTMIYSEDEIKRIAECAFDLASMRSDRVCSVDKANVLDTSRLWRSVVTDMSKNYPNIKLEHMYVDNAAMQLVLNPAQFDCILTGNIFGDILSDLASTITGSIGMLPSASIGGKTFLFEPVHGSAPDIAGKNLANPLASFLCLGSMLELTFNIKTVNQDINNAVQKTLTQGRTVDIWEEGKQKLACSEITDLFISILED